MRGMKGLAAAAALGLSVLLGGGAVRGTAEEQPPLQALAQSGIQDLSAVMVMGEQDARELERMGKDFKDAYRFNRARLQFLEPGRMRMESRVGFLTVLYVVSGNRKMLAIPGIGVRSVKDISSCPGCRQGLTEVGVLPASLLDSVEVQPLGASEAAGAPTWRYSLKYKGDHDGKRQEIAVDPRTHTLTERLLFNGEGRLKARFLFSDPVEAAGGIWVPQKAELYSPAGKRAAVTRYEQVRVNAGVKESAFVF